MSAQVANEHTKQVDLVSILHNHDDHLLEISIKRETTIAKIPGSGLCWIVSFLIGLYLRLETDSEKNTFAEIIGGLPEIDLEFVQWIRDGSFVQKSIDWTKESFQDSPLYPLIDALKMAVMINAQYLLDEIFAEYRIDSETRDCIPKDWVDDFEHETTRYGYPLTIRIVQKFFEQNGLKTNVVMFGDVFRLRSFNREGFIHCQNFDKEVPTIATYFTGNHFDLLTEHPKIVNDISERLEDTDVYHGYSHSESPPPLPSAEEAQSTQDPLVEDLLRQLEEANRRIVETERNAEQRIAEIERNAAQRVSEAEQRVSDTTSHTEQDRRVMEEMLEQSLRSNDELRDEISKLRKNQSDADEALARLRGNLGRAFDALSR